MDFHQILDKVLHLVKGHGIAATDSFYLFTFLLKNFEMIGEQIKLATLTLHEESYSPFPTFQNYRETTTRMPLRLIPGHR